MFLKLKEMKMNIKQKAAKRQDAVGNVFYKSIFLFYFIYKNKKWSVVYHKQNSNKPDKIWENLLYKVGPAFCLSKIKSSQNRML